MANIFTQNPMRVDTAMASAYLATIGASAGLERPIKVTEIVVENVTPTAGLNTIQDAGGNTIYEVDLPATVGTTIDSTQRLWRDFKVSTIQAGVVIWIHRR